MSISVFGIGAIPLLEAIPGSFESSDLLEFTSGPEPIIECIAWEAVTLKIDFICATPDFFVIWCVVCRSILCMRLNGTYVMLQGHISLAFQCHTRALSFHSCSLDKPDISAPRVPTGEAGTVGTRTVSLVRSERRYRQRAGRCGWSHRSLVWPDQSLAVRRRSPGIRREA
jgi:hypothetical protein